MPKTARCFSTILVMIVLTSCDPTKELDKYYGDQGLTRLRYVRDDLQPGAFIVVTDGGKPVYMDNIFDYADKPSEQSAVGTTGGDRTGDYNAILASYKSDRSMEAKLAFSFLATLLPLKLDSVLSTSGNVTIDTTQAKVERMKIPDLNRYLGNAESEGFRTFANQQLSATKGASGYLAYEIFRTNKLKITTSSKFDFKPSVSLSNNTAIIKEGSASFEIKRSSDSLLEISGDRFYAFAIRTAMIVPAQNNGLRIDTGTKFIPKSALGAKEGVEYSRPVAPNYQAVDLASMFLRPK